MLPQGTSNLMSIPFIRYNTLVLYRRQQFIVEATKGLSRDSERASNVTLSQRGARRYETMSPQVFNIDSAVVLRATQATRPNTS